MRTFAERVKEKAKQILQIEPSLALPERLKVIGSVFADSDYRTFADLGAVWRVNAGYTFYTLENFEISSAIIVDTHPNDIVLEQAKKFPQLKIVKGNFGDEAVASEVGEVDVIYLFDVLLHQVKPDWHQILEIYADQTKCFVIINPQWIGSAQTVRLLDLGEDAFFENVPHDRADEAYAGLFEKLNDIHPDHGRPWRDVHHIWQWGITDADLIKKVESLGFQLKTMENSGVYGPLVNFEKHAFVFVKTP